MHVQAVTTWSPALKKFLLATLLGGVVSLAALAVGWFGLLERVEHTTLDHRFLHYANPGQASPEIVLVAVDEESLRVFGRWPWPRDRHGYMVQYLQEAGAKAIVFDILFPEPDTENAEFDQAFIAALRSAGNVFLPFMLESTAASPTPDTLSNALLPVPMPQARAALLPMPGLAAVAQGLGFVDLFPDSDGTLRHIPLLAQTPQTTWPQLAMAVARSMRGAEPKALRPGALQLGDVTVPLTRQGTMVINWHGRLEDTYRSYAAGAVLQSFLERQEGRTPLLPPATFKDKIVFIGATAAGTYDLRVTPLSPFTPGVLTHMTVLDNLLHGHFLRPAAFWMTLLTLCVLCLGTSWSLMLVQPHALGVSLIGALAAGYYALTVYAFRAHGLWLELALPSAALVLTYALSATGQYLTEGQRRWQLRVAFDKYMSADVVDAIMRHPDGIKLGGERREISVFFSDVAGFTTI